jgi:transposase InsO family protein
LVLNLGLPSGLGPGHGGHQDGKAESQSNKTPAIAMESFFSTYKLENDLDDNSKILLTPWGLPRETAYWIEGYYNRERLHSFIKYLSPIEYEERTRRGSIISEE